MTDSIARALLPPMVPRFLDIALALSGGGGVGVEAGEIHLLFAFISESMCATPPEVEFCRVSLSAESWW